MGNKSARNSESVIICIMHNKFKTEAKSIVFFVFSKLLIFKIDDISLSALNCKKFSNYRQSIVIVMHIA